MTLHQLIAEFDRHLWVGGMRESSINYVIAELKINITTLLNEIKEEIETTRLSNGQLLPESLEGLDKSIRYVAKRGYNEALTDAASIITRVIIEEK